MRNLTREVYTIKAIFLVSTAVCLSLYLIHDTTNFMK